MPEALSRTIGCNGPKAALQHTIAFHAARVARSAMEQLK